MKFCGKCGHPLPLRCQTCGAVNPSDFEFCKVCENRLEIEHIPSYARRSPRDYTPQFLVETVLNQRNSLSGERKTVSVMFVDVAGFSRISESFDPEIVHEMMNGCFEIFGQEIHGVGGTINQYTGDGVMALFGAPVAFEDHASRACYAALGIQKRLKEYARELRNAYGIHFQIRTGLNMGEVVVGAIGDNLRLDYTAIGDTTNLAARIESLAPPGKIWASQKIRNAANASFRFRKAGHFQVKGKKRSVSVFSLLGQRRDIDLSIKGPGKRVPFTGRRDELSSMKNSLETAMKGKPRLLIIEGEAGLGKSRLLEQFQKLLNPDQVLLLAGRGQSYGQTMAFHPFFQMLKSYFQFTDNESYQDIRVKLREKVRNKRVLSGFEQILSVFEQVRADEGHNEMINESRKQEIFSILRNLLEDCLSASPLVMCLDDMQWVDPTTIDFLHFFLSSSVTGSMLVICAGRPPGITWPPDIPQDLIRLKPMPTADSLHVFNAALGTNRLVPAIGKKILSSAGGNPLFLTEVGQTLRHQKMIVCDEEQCTLRFEVEDLTIPETIRDVLTARLDALPELGKKVGQLASIIGRTFARDILKHLVHDESELSQGLLMLMDEGVIEQISSDMGGRYTFRHQMMQEVTYGSLLRQSRKKYHRIVAGAIESLYRNSLDTQFTVLSYHYYQAQDWHKALAYTLDAGLRARRSFACQEALTCFIRALDIFKRGQWIHADVKATQLYKWKGGMHFCLSEMTKSRYSFQKMLALAEKQDDQEVEAEAIFRLGWVAFYSHRPRSAEHFLSRALKKSERHGVLHIHLKACSFLGQLHSMLGRFEKARPLLIQSLDLSDEVYDPEGKAWSLAFLIQYYNWTGEFAEALALSHELSQLNKIIQSPFFNMMLHFRQGLIVGALGRLEEAEKILRSGLSHVEVGVEQFWRPRFLNTIGWIKAEAGEYERALALNRQSLEEALPTGDAETINNARINIAENFLQLDRPARAQRFLEESWNDVKSSGLAYTKWRYKTRLLLALAEYNRMSGEREKALALSNKALELARKAGARKHEVRALRMKAAVLSRAGLSLNILNQALTLAKKMNTSLLIRKIEQDLSETKRRV